jgi:hypothetical protein
MSIPFVGRRSAAKLWILVPLTVLVAACSPSTPSASQHSTRTTSVASGSAKPPTTITPASLAGCSASQLRIGFRGTQSATGDYFAAFWVADVSMIPCELSSSVKVSLLNSTGSAQLTASRDFAAPIPLSSNTTMPTEGGNPLTGQNLADVTLEWPTVFDSEYSSPPGSGDCREPEFSPSAVRFAFSGVQPVVVADFPPSMYAVHGLGYLCGPSFTVSDVSAP